MDAFAENQMGRDSDVSSPQPVRRARRSSKELTGKKQLSDAELQVVEATMKLLRAEAPQDAPIFDVPSFSVDDSNVIAQRWNRKQSTFMPVGDPYAEPDTSVPYWQQFSSTYCTLGQLLKYGKGALRGLFPIIDWGPKLNCAKLKADLIAGLTVGVMLIPQSMSYANIAGLQYKYGMYTSVLPIIVYALMGSSRQLGVGPVAMVSLLVEVGLQGALTPEECPAYYAQFEGLLKDASGEPIVDDILDFEPQYNLCPDEYAKLAFLTSFLVGIFQVGTAYLPTAYLPTSCLPTCYFLLPASLSASSRWEPACLSSVSSSPSSPTR